MNLDPQLSRVALGLTLIPALFFSCPRSARAQDSSAQAAPATPAPPSADAAAKAAERKKRFEEAKKQLDEKTPPAAPQPQVRVPQVSPYAANPVPPAVTEPLVFSLNVTMAIGETQRFRLYDNTRQDLTSQAQWTVSDPAIAELSMAGGSPSLVGKKAGTTYILARANSHSARVVLNVVYKDQIAKATRWNQNEVSSDTLLTIVPAIPQLAPHP